MPHPTSRRLALAALASALTLGAVTAHARVQTMIVTSDPQYPWTERTDAGLPENDEERNRRSERLIREQYESIAAYRAARPGEDIPVIVNGDLTAYGHGWQRTKMDELLGILGDNVHLGLGNHDYQNNIRQPDGNGCYNNGCARDSIEDIARHVRRKRTRLSFDWTTDQGALSDTHSGSLAYAFTGKGFEGALQFQLNNHPDYEASFSSLYNLRTQEYRITRSLPWMNHILSTHLPRPEHEFAIVHMHQDTHLGPDFARAMSTHGVTAIFAGHLHHYHGRYGTIGGTPIYLSGSASQRTYLIVEHDTDTRELRIYGVRDNDPSKKTLIESLSTRRGG